MVLLQPEEVQALFEEVEANEGCELTVDLPSQKVCSPGGQQFSFEMDPFAKHCLLNGLDDIGWTLGFAEQITTYEQQARTQAPWAFLDS